MFGSFSRAQGVSRRQMLQRSGLGAVGLNLAGLLNAESAAGQQAVGSGSAIRSCIVIFYYGGPSHLDTFDLKPDAPAEVRGEFNPISTSVPGLQICEHLPHTARVMHHVAVVRSLHHTNRLHDSASTETLTGRQSPQGDREEFAAIPQFFPCYGASFSYMKRGQKIDVSHAALPWVFHNVVDTPCQGGGFLGPMYDPLQITGDPASVAYSSKSLSRPEDLSDGRLKQRLSLAASLESGSALNSLQAARNLNTLYDKAIELMQSEAVLKAMRVEEEPQAVRERYGLYSDRMPEGVREVHGHQLRGQNLLLARRLVEAGVPFVNVYDFRQQGQNWDSHSDNFGEHKNRLLPPADRAYAALIEDLHERGLLQSTLVVALGEFGRTPKINSTAGRDHWPDCYSMTLAGGGIRGGMVYGSSDRLGAYPESDPVTPADLAATIFWRFGIDPQAHIHDHTGRPYHLADGVPITDLFG